MKKGIFQLTLASGIGLFLSIFMQESQAGIPCDNQALTACISQCIDQMGTKTGMNPQIAQNFTQCAEVCAQQVCPCSVINDPMRLQPPDS